MNVWNAGTAGLVALALLAGLGLPRILQGQPIAPEEQRPPVVIDQDYRGGRSPVEPVVAFGPNAERVCRPDEKGWRITLPADRPEPGAVGLVTTTPLHGDFEIVVRYEILHADQPRAGNGVGLELYLLTQTRTKEAMGFSRLQRVVQGEVHTWSRMTTSPEGKRLSKTVNVATDNMSGRLRVTRRGTEAILWASEEGSDDFRELTRMPLGSEDVVLVRASAYTGNIPYALDLRIVELKIRTENLTAGQAAALPIASAVAQAGGLPHLWQVGWTAQMLVKDPVVDPAAPGAISPNAASPNAAAPKSERKGWLAAGVLGFVILLAFFGGWLFVRQRRRADETAKAPPAPEQTPQPEAAPAPVAFTCAGCAARLKGRATLAGKKIKCPRCGQVISVPANRAVEPEAIPSPGQE
jgi:hypothetical protein